MDQQSINLQPKNINDIIFGNIESKLRIYDIVKGNELVPSFGKSGIILYGAYGTGKTTLAKMLPQAIEHGRTNSELNSDFDFFACQQGTNGSSLIELVSKISSKVSLNLSGLHYIIIDEVDMLTKLAQQSMKSAMNTTRCVFILTTNNISQLDKGMIDRCITVEMNAANETQLFPFAELLAKNMGAEISKDELAPIIKAANGSFRNISHNTERYIRCKNIPKEIIF